MFLSIRDFLPVFFREAIKTRQEKSIQIYDERISCYLINATIAAQ